MGKEEREIRSERQRNGLCHVCSVKAPTGCCPKHCMNCGLCNGEGSISHALWEKFYGKKILHRTLGSSSSKKMEEIKEWFLGSIDSIDHYGCENCWADCRGCTCESDKEKMKTALIEELRRKL